VDRVGMVIPLNGGTARQPLPAGQTLRQFSPDGSRILYQFGDRQQTELGILALADSSTRRVTTTPVDGGLAQWTAGGGGLIFFPVGSDQPDYDGGPHEAVGGAEAVGYARERRAAMACSAVTAPSHTRSRAGVGAILTRTCALTIGTIRMLDRAIGFDTVVCSFLR